MMTLESLTGDEALARRDELATIYRAAFREPPWNTDESAVDAWAARLAVETRRPEFRAVLASDGAPVGFGAAWRTPSPFPTGRAYDRVRAELGDEVDRRLVGAWEVDELAVSPAARGQGLAGRILGLLCAGAGPSWLLTDPRAADAVRLYRRLGWRPLTAETAGIAVFVKTP